MKKTIIFKTMLVSMALVSLSSCYDMDEMSKNPYELPDNTTGGGEEQPGEEDNTKYADINIIIPRNKTFMPNGSQHRSSP